MITGYHRPQTLEEALALLGRSQPQTRPLGGGTSLTREDHSALAGDFEVVDLQALGLNQIDSSGSLIQVGATTTLQALFDDPGLQQEFHDVLSLEVNPNIRQMATLAGRLVSADGRSPLATTLLALDARLTWEPGETVIGLGDWMSVRGHVSPGKLITRVAWSGQATLAYQQVARTPADRPLVCVAVAAWPSSRTRVALGGYGAAPRLVLDGPESGGAEVAARAAYSQAGDAWASAEYRQAMVELLTRRCLASLFEVQTGTTEG
jgi:CO/xanthine dehydrogenase FAD-binding subunit